MELIETSLTERIKLVAQITYSQQMLRMTPMAPTVLAVPRTTVTKDAAPALPVLIIYPGRKKQTVNYITA